MAKTEAELAKKFSPTHITDQIPENTEDLKKEVEGSVSTKKEEPSPTEDPKSQKEYTFKFDWTNPVGKRYQGEFTNKILTIADKQNVGIMRARLGGGMPVESLDGLTIEINLMVSHMTFSLIKTPTWADDLRALIEHELIQEIYMEVASHEATFSGYGAVKEGS